MSADDHRRDQAFRRGDQAKCVGATLGAAARPRRDPQGDQEGRHRAARGGARERRRDAPRGRRPDQGAVGAVRDHQPPRQDPRHFEPAARRAALGAAAVDRNAAGCLGRRRRVAVALAGAGDPPHARAGAAPEPGESSMAPVSSIAASPLRSFETRRASNGNGGAHGRISGRHRCSAASRCGPPPPRLPGRP